MKVLFPDYNKSLNNFASSILKCFGVECGCSSLNRIDKLLRSEDYSNIIILSFNGLSTNFMERNLDRDSILVSNKVFNITSTFPSSDVTSTMSFLSIKTPLEHGFIDKRVDISTFSEFDDKRDFKTYGDKTFDSVFDKINRNSKSRAYALFPCGKGKYKNREEAYKTIVNISNSSGKKLIYAYFDDLDKVMMSTGVESIETFDEIKKIEIEIKELCDKLVDSIVFVISEYGNIDCSEIRFRDCSLNSYVEKVVCVEPRCSLIRVTKNRQEEFKKVFDEEFSDKFLLISYDRAIEDGLFGIGGVDRWKVNEDEWDFIVIATDKYYLRFDGDKSGFDDEGGFLGKACHGGLTEKEMFVPIVAIKKRVFRDGVRVVEKNDYEEVRKMSSYIQKSRASIRKDLFSNVGPITHSDFIKYCGRNATETCFVYTIEDKIVGFIKVKLKTLGGYRLYNDFAYIEIENVFVKEKYRRKGIGSELVRYVIDYAKKRHVKKIEFRAWNFEKDTFKFVEKFKSGTLFTVFEIDL